MCLINFLTTYCTKNDGLTIEPRNYIILRWYVAKTNFEVIKGTCHVGMIEQTMEISKVTTEVGQSISYTFEWQHPIEVDETGFYVLCEARFKKITL